MKIVVVIAAVLLVCGRASAYPDMIAKGYTNCGSCHYNPTGGGFINSYGMAAQQASLPDDWQSDFVTHLREGPLAKADVTGYDDAGKSKLQVGLDLDSRWMLTTVPSGVAQSVGINFFPMLLEVGGVVAWGKLLVYGAVGPKDPEGDGISWKAASREHWVRLQATEALSFRVGRMFLPFGLRIPDHTAFSRSDLGFGYYDQTYAAEADYMSEYLAISAAGSVGNYMEAPAQLRERGGAVSAAFNLPSRASIGVSGLYLNSDLQQRSAIAVFARVHFFEHAYALAEVDGQRKRADRTGDTQDNVATLLRLGCFVKESLDLYVEHDFRATQAAAVSEHRYTAGASWWLLPWAEIIPMVQVTQYPDTGAYVGGYLQAHVYY